MPNYRLILDRLDGREELEALSAGVIEEEIPLNRAQRNRLPSDHLSIEVTVRPSGRSYGSPLIGGNERFPPAEQREPHVDKSRPAFHHWLQRRPSWNRRMRP